MFFLKRKKDIYAQFKPFQLWMPFYHSRYRNPNLTQFPDLSGNKNHGTIVGAVPGTYPILSGFEQVTNGTFTGDTDWTKGAEWTITTVATATAGTASDLEQAIGAVTNKRYCLLYTLTRTAGSLTPQIGGVNGTARSASGTYEDIIIATGTGNLKFQKDSSFAGTVDNVSVKEVTGYEGLGWGFNGASYLNCGNDSSLNMLDEISILTWIRPGATTAQNDTIASRGVYNTRGWWMIFNNPTTMLMYTSQLGAAQGQPSLSVFTPGVFQLAGFTKSGKNGLWYRNGIDVTGTHADLTNMATSTDNLLIGSYNGLSSFYKGGNGEMLIFNRTLTAPKVRSFFEVTRDYYSV